MMLLPPVGARTIVVGMAPEKVALARLTPIRIQDQICETPFNAKDGAVRKELDGVRAYVYRTVEGSSIKIAFCRRRSPAELHLQLLATFQHGFLLPAGGTLRGQSYLTLRLGV
ncbi:hypothetical protein NDU88_001691 [Pleurodeles waltl]|uniref:Uncharacterized protein n=1 Tax=Pleurodeles waltl TaxID=8319 RepID=A0AAV7RAN2_PLEWA|nr:hypothetical protein NDU88_001691 [Pleurodeles waltl]